MFTFYKNWNILIGNQILIAMKYILLFALFLSCHLQAQILEKDSLALVDLYDRMNGSQWTQSDGWLSTPVEQWYGIFTEGNRVTGINLYNNNLSGSIPESIGNLDALVSLDLGESSFQGPLPPELSNCEALEDISLARCGFTGSIPEEWSSLKQLERIDLNSNELSGSFPGVVFEWPQIQSIELGSNNFSGNLPQNIGDLNTLNVLGISRNSFEGEVPSSLKNLINIGALYFGENQFEGDISEFMTYFPSLFYLRLNNNSFTGFLDTIYFDLDVIRWLDVDYSNIESIGDFQTASRINRLNVSGTKINMSDIERNSAIDGQLQYSDLQDRFVFDSLKVNEGEELTLVSGIDGEKTEYTWLFNGDTLSSENEPDLVISNFREENQGIYQCIGSHPDFEVEIRRGMVQLTLANPANTEQSESNGAVLKIYPNPSADIVRLQWEGAIEGELNIISTEGKHVQASRVGNGQVLRVSHLPKGSYILLVQEGRKIYSSTFVKE